MKSRIFTLNINNYFPQMMEITVPLMKKYAKKIGAEFIEIKERKFQDWHIYYEKMQIHELGKDSIWNIFIDGDVLIHPDFQDITKCDPKYVLLYDGYSASVKFLPNDYFYRDGRNVGLSSCFLASHKCCHDIWTPLIITPDEVDEQIIVSDNDIKHNIAKAQEEYALSLNLARYGIKYNGIDHKLIYHSYKSHRNQEKLEEIKNVLKNWEIN